MNYIDLSIYIYKYFNKNKYIFYLNYILMISWFRIRLTAFQQILLLKEKIGKSIKLCRLESIGYINDIFRHFCVRILTLINLSVFSDIPTLSE